MSQLFSQSAAQAEKVWQVPLPEVGLLWFSGLLAFWANEGRVETR
jgi:hypothetical protein